MVNSVPEFFNMPIQHCGVAMHSYLMRCLVNIKPTFSINFIRTYFFPDLRMKNFCTASWQRVQASFPKKKETFFCGQSSFSKHIIKLNSRITFYMKVGAMG